MILFNMFFLDIILTNKGASIMSENSNLVTSTQNIIEQALYKLGYDEGLFELIKEPARFLRVRIPVKMDDGSVKTFTGYRSQHNSSVGPTKGGVRFHPDVDENEVKALSMWMTLKCGLVNLPYGGGKGAIQCDPHSMSQNELERLSRGYVRAIAQIVGPTKDIPAPDVYTDAQIMSWMMDEYSIMHKVNAPNFITGKPISLGGSLGREQATALGAVITIEEAAKRKHINIEGSKVVVQGFGNAGSFIAKILHDKGAKIVCISESRGAIYDPEGLDIDHLLELRKEHGRITPLFDNIIPNEDIFGIDCDILVPAALANQITAQNAGDIKASIVAEAANGPTTQEATRILTENDVLLIPDVLASAGGVTVSYFEWVQNNQGLYWSEEEVNQLLRTKIVEAFDKVYDISQKRKLDMRLSAYVVGVRRTAEATRFRG